MQHADQPVVRLARESDRDVLAAMWTDFLDEQGRLDSRFVLSDDALERWGNDFSEWIGAGVHGLFVADQEEAGLVGYALVHLWFPAPIYQPELEAHLDELFVHREWRRRGVATALLDAVKEWASSHEARRIRLGVLSANETGLAFWKSNGARPFIATLLIDP